MIPVYCVEIEFDTRWYRIGEPYLSRADAEWAIGLWRQRHGSNGQDTGFRVVETTLNPSDVGGI